MIPPLRMRSVIPDAGLVPGTGLKPRLVVCTCQDVGTGVWTGSGWEGEEYRGFAAPGRRLQCQKGQSGKGFEM